jgi:hypothetical protein
MSEMGVCAENSDSDVSVMKSADQCVLDVL